MNKNAVAVFTKPWMCDLNTLAKTMRELDVHGVELPVRPGYPVNPENVSKELPNAVRTLGANGLKVYSVASEVNDATIGACGEAGIPVIRVMERIAMDAGYHACISQAKRKYEAAIPSLEKHGVKIGLQNHCDYFIGSAIGTMHAIGDFDPRHIGAVLDVAHCALDGEPEDMAIDIVWSHLCMVNLKNAIRRPVKAPDDREAKWRIFWTSGRDGYASWRETVRTLRDRGYAGPLCLTAEYSDPKSTGDLQGDDCLALLADDLAYLRSLSDD